MRFVGDHDDWLRIRRAVFDFAADIGRRGDEVPSGGVLAGRSSLDADRKAGDNPVSFGGEGADIASATRRLNVRSGLCFSGSVFVSR
jgi:hypothetical protein